METSLVLDPSKQLGLQFKKRFEHSSDVCLKIKGVLNTVTAITNVEGALYKFFRLGNLPASTPGQVYKPDERLRLGVGVRALSTTDEVLFSVAAKKKFSIAKQIDIIRGREVIDSYTQLVVGAHYDYSLRKDYWSGEAVAAANHAIFRFSDDQDIRVTAGMRSVLSPRGASNPEPFLRVQENNWGVVTNLKGDWRVTYDL